MLEFELFYLKMRRWELHQKIEQEVGYVPACIRENGKRLYRELTDGMADRYENIRHWYNHEDCIYINPTTGAEEKVNVPHDYEAIYCFLKYCGSLDRAGELDPAFVEYLER